MSDSRSNSQDGRKRKKHSLFADTFDVDTIPWKPRDGIRRRGRQREDIGRQLGRMRQLRSFTSWRDMKQALDSPRAEEVSPGTEGRGSPDSGVEVHLEPARLSLPPHCHTSKPNDRPPLTLLYLKENTNPEEQHILPSSEMDEPEWENGEKITSLMFSDSQWKELKRETQKKITMDEKKMRKELELNNRKQNSIEMAKTWDNTYINMRRRRHEKRKERIKKENEQKELIYKKVREENEKEYNRLRNKAKEEAFYEQDSTKMYHSAFRVSEVLAEREAQLEFNKKLKKIDKEIETKYAQSIMDDAKRYKEEQEEILRKNKELKQTLGIEAQKRYKEAEQLKKAEEEKRLKAEKEDMEHINRQMLQVIENERNEKNRKREVIRKSLMENRELVEKNNEIRKLEEEEENNAIQIIANGKARIAKIRIEREKKMLDEKRTRRQKLSNTIQQENQAKLEKEEQCFKIAVEELEAKHKEDKEKERQYQEMLRTEKINSHLEYMKKEEERLAKERELLKWEILKRFKREELNNQFMDRLKEEKKNRVHQNKNIYSQQINSDINRRMKEKEIELNAAKNAQWNWDMNDKQFLEYAYKVREESKNKGRSLFPLDAAIYEFKKKNQLLGNVRNFIYESEVPKPEGIKEIIYNKQVVDEEKGNVRSRKCACNVLNNVLEREECGCPKTANGL